MRHILRKTIFGILLVLLLVGMGWVEQLAEAQEYTVRQEHPRIFLTPERLARLKSDYANNEPHVAALKQFSDEGLGVSLPLPPTDPTDIAAFNNYSRDLINTVSKYIEALALCYQITDDSRYSDKAIAFIRAYIQWLDDNFDFESSWNNFPRDPAIVFHETDYGVFRLPAISIAFDWLYDQLTDPDKEYIVTILNECIDSAMVRQGLGYGNPVSNHGQGKNRTELFLGLATYGDNSRAEELINTAYDLFTTGMMPLYNQYNPGGQIYMGTNYGYGRTLHFALYTVEALRTALSIDLYAQNPWLEDVIYYVIHAQHPQGGTTYTHGTRGIGTILSLTDWRNYRNWEFLRSAYAGNVSRAYLADFMIRQGYDSISPYNDLAAYQSLFRDTDVAAVDYRGLPPAYLSGTYPPDLIKGLGLFLARSDWSEDALWMSLQSGDLVGDHQWFDMGHFTIFRGKSLVSNVNVNRVEIGQYRWRQDWTYLALGGFSPTGSQVEAFENTDDYAYVKTDLTRTYYGSEFQGQVVRSKVLNQEVSKTTRSAILLRPDYIVFCDRTGTISDTVPTTWVVHLDGTNVNISDNTYSSSVDGNALYIRTLYPSGIQANSEIVYTNFTKIRVEPTSPVKNELYLHFFYAPFSDTGSMPPVDVIGASSMIGAQTEDSIIMFSREETELKSGQFDITGSGTYRTIIADLTPNTNYDVSIDGSPLGTYAATDSGLLAFNLSLTGSHSVVISSGPSDIIRPSAITDLEASTGAQPGSVDLTWTATGDDGDTGIATSYIIRYSVSPITSVNWDSATDVNGEPSPQPAGASETFTMFGLTAGQTYYFAIAARDEMANISDISNSPSAAAGSDTTPPVISGITSSNITNVTATIFWSTNEPANSVVEYGITTSYGSISSDATLQTTHAQTLAGLSPDTTYHYRVRSTDASGNTATSGDFTFTTTLSPNSPPTATASANRAIGEAPLIVIFTGSGSDTDGSIVSYYWDFGDGGTSNEQNPTHIYNNPGTYIANLTVTDNDGATAQDTVDITVISSSPTGNIYYVDPNGSDSNPGTQTQPWLTLQHAANTAQAGDTVLVNGGTYVGFRAGNSGTATNPITFRANGNNVLVNSGYLGRRDNIEINGYDYIVIDGFRVENAIRSGITVLDARGVTIQNCRVNANSKWGIFSGFTPQIKILNNIASNSQGVDGEHGIYISNSRDPDDNPIIRGNVCFGNNRNGIQINGDLTSGGDGIITGAIIENNVVYDNNWKGFSLISMANSIVRNNLLYNNGIGAGAGGIHLAEEPGTDRPSSNNLIVNNTINEPRIAGIRITDGTGNVIFNNIVVSGRDTIVDEAGGNYVDTTSNIEQASTAGLFVNPAAGDYHLSATSPAIDAGRASYQGENAPNIDIEGSIRPQRGSYDIGAYEYVSPTIRGDVNGDGLVNVVDVQLAVNQFLGVIPQTQEADLNGDGVVNVIDVQLLVNIILGG